MALLGIFNIGKKGPPADTPVHTLASIPVKAYTLKCFRRARYASEKSNDQSSNGGDVIVLEYLRIMEISLEALRDKKLFGSNLLSSSSMASLSHRP